MTPEPQSESILYVISEMQTQLKLRAEHIRQLEDMFSERSQRVKELMDEITMLRTRLIPLQEVVNDFVTVCWRTAYRHDSTSFEGTITDTLLKRAQVLYSTEQ